MPHVLPLLPPEVQTLREATFSEVRVLGAVLGRLAAGAAAAGGAADGEDDGASVAAAGAGEQDKPKPAAGDEQDFDAMVRATMKKKEAAEKAKKAAAAAAAGGGAVAKKSSGAKQEEAAQRKQQAELAAVARLRGALSRLDRLAGLLATTCAGAAAAVAPYVGELLPFVLPLPSLPAVQAAGGGGGGGAPAWVDGLFDALVGCGGAQLRQRRGASCRALLLALAAPGLPMSETEGLGSVLGPLLDDYHQAP